MNIPTQPRWSFSPNQQRIIAVILGFVGAGLIIAGMFFPSYIYKFGHVTIAVPTDIDYLERGEYTVLSTPLLALLAPFFALRSFRSPGGRWWTISFGAIFLFDTLNLVLLLPSLLVFHTAFAYLARLASGFFLKEAGYLLVGIGAWYAARLAGKLPPLSATAHMPPEFEYTDLPH